MSRISAKKRELAPGSELTEKMRILAKEIVNGRSIELAAKMAGYNAKAGGYRWALESPTFKAYVKRLQEKNERMMDMSRKRVMDGFLEAIEQAKTMAEPMTQIAGWRELAKMCGYYAPEVKNININVSAQRLISQLETMSDQELLEVIEHDAEAIEGEARELLEHVPDRNLESDSTAAPTSA